MIPSWRWIARISWRRRHPDLRVEGGQGLVEQQHLRLEGERAGERDALLLAARELVRVARGLVAEVDEVQQLLDPLPDLVRRPLPDLQPEADVVGRRSCSGTARRTGRPSRRCAGSAADTVMSVPSSTIVPAVGSLEAGDHPQRRRLAAAGRAEEADELAALGGEVEVLHGDGRAEVLLDAGQYEEAHRVIFSWLSGRRRR